MSNKQNRGSFAGGMILIIIGLFFFLGKFSLMPPEIYYALLRWPTILIVVGIYLLFQKSYSSASVLIGIGTLFLMPQWLNFSFQTIWQYWPLLLVAIGLLMLVKPKKKPKAAHFYSQPSFQTISDDIIEVTAILTSDTRRVSSNSFKGGVVRIVLGGSEVCLMNAEPVADGATIDLSVLLGGVEIVVSADWNVIVETTAILGGVSDNRKHVATNSQKTLRLTGQVIMGGIEIKNG